MFGWVLAYCKTVHRWVQNYFSMEKFWFERVRIDEYTRDYCMCACGWDMVKCMPIIYTFVLYTYANSCKDRCMYIHMYIVCMFE